MKPEQRERDGWSAPRFRSAKTPIRRLGEATRFEQLQTMHARDEAAVKRGRRAPDPSLDEFLHFLCVPSRVELPCFSCFAQLAAIPAKAEDKYSALLFPFPLSRILYFFTRGMPLPRKFSRRSRRRHVVVLRTAPRLMPNVALWRGLRDSFRESATGSGCRAIAHRHRPRFSWRPLSRKRIAATPRPKAMFARAASTGPARLSSPSRRRW